jgi:hypothetical protein
MDQIIISGPIFRNWIILWRIDLVLGNGLVNTFHQARVSNTGAVDSVVRAVLIATQRALNTYQQ